VCVCSFFTSILARLYTGAFFQFMIGLIGASSLCTFIKPGMVGAVGFKFTYFHLSIFGINCWHSLCSLLPVAVSW
jgi:hypothetical protein